MKRALIMLSVAGMLLWASPLPALTINYDGQLTEWTGDEINNLGTRPAPDGGSYTFLAAWNGSALHLGMDRSSSGRYLGDDGANDSFFVAIDTDGVADSGADQDGYTRVNFDGPMKPDIIYYFAGGSGWYERGLWTGTDWSWLGWTDGGGESYYGYQPENPDDEITPDLLFQQPSLSGESELMVWAWMTREAQGNVTASWPDGHTGNQPTFGDPIPIRDEETLLLLPDTPTPADMAVDVVIDPCVSLSWGIAREAGSTVDPNLTAYKVYIGTSADPNLVLEATVTSWDTQTLRAGYSFTTAVTDETYFWRVDTVLDTSEEVPGDVWTFDTELSSPIITDGPDYQVVADGTTAMFSIVVETETPASYQWYKFVDGVNDDELADGGDISGATTNALSIANVELADEGGYYCIVNNESGIETTSDIALLGVKRLIAAWSFENQDPNSQVAGSPISLMYGDPCFVAAGKVGDALAFDNDEDAEDILYTDPDEASYFDICHHSMTVGCWINSGFAATWGAMVARNGEDDEGWQLRHHGSTLDRVTLTTRGTGNDDGTASNRPVFNGEWHYVVGTYDAGTGEKKVYIDGIVSRVYDGDTGEFIRDADEVSGLINETLSPVAIGGRVKGNPIDGLIFEGQSVSPAVIDEVEIYNYALSPEAIAQMYANVEGVPVCPVLLPNDLNGDCKVTLEEIESISSDWLTDMNVTPMP